MEELAEVVGVERACSALGVSRSSYYRAHQSAQPIVVEHQLRSPHPRALSVSEQQAIGEYLNSERFVDLSPRAIYAILLEEGVYLCHWRTMYRLLAADGATRERRAIRRHRVYSRPELLATAPNQVWSWDITMLRGPVAGLWYRLYLVLDIFSRKVVGWLVAETEDALLAEQLIADACEREAIESGQLTLHADRGAVMQSNTLALLMEDLGVGRSHSRPSVSNDNPYSEAQFKTMKYCPSYPKRFGSLEEARQWVEQFVRWYNREHRHSGIGLLTPEQVHRGQEQEIQAVRQECLDEAYANHPERFVAGRPKPPEVPSEVWINPPQQNVSLPTNDKLATLPVGAPLSRVSAA